MNYTYTPPLLLKNGLISTVYTALKYREMWEQTISDPAPKYQEKIFIGAQGVPIFGIYAIPEKPRGTIIATYGITGDLDNQWFLRILGRKGFAANYAIILFDWRAHGKTAQLSPTLTSDGLYEGEDFLRIAAEAKKLGCPAPFWFAGYSLGGQLALWGIKTAQNLSALEGDLEIEESEIGGGAVICPSIESNRSLSYLVADFLGKYLEKAIAKSLKELAWEIHKWHPQDIDPEAIKRANSIWGFDRELVIGRLGFSTVEEYYYATSPIYILPQLTKPTLILYAADDPMFDPALVPELKEICQANSSIDLILTAEGGHVSYISNKTCQQQYQDNDRWWAWNRIIEWYDRQK